MDYSNIDIKVKDLMYKLYQKNFNGKPILLTFDEFFRYNIKLDSYYKIADLQFRKEKINKIYDRISNR